MNASYQGRTLASANGVELVVALYDGMIRFLHQSISAIEDGNVRERRRAVKRVIDIILHLESRLRHSNGPDVAQSLENFYASILKHTLEASAANSADGLASVIENIASVRSAWRTVAADRNAISILEAREAS